MSHNAIQSALTRAIQSASEIELAAAIASLGPGFSMKIGSHAGQALRLASSTGWAPGCAALLAAARINDPALERSREAITTALFFSAHKARPEAIALLAPLADLSARDYNGLTALMAALNSPTPVAEDSENIHIVVDKNQEARTPQPAGLSDHQARVIACVEALIPFSSLADLNSDFKTPLMISAGLPEPMASALTRLLAPLSDASCSDHQEKTAFCLALEAKSYATARLLITPKLCQMSCREDGFTPLMAAIDLGALELIEDLAPHSAPQRVFALYSKTGVKREISAVGLAFSLGAHKALTRMAHHIDPFAPMDGSKLSVLSWAFDALQYATLNDSLADLKPEPLEISLFLDRLFERARELALPEKTSVEFAGALGAARDDWAHLLFPNAILDQARGSAHGANALGMSSGRLPQWTLKLLPLFNPSQIAEPNESGADALMLSATYGDLESLRALLPRSNPHQSDNDGDSALMRALLFNHSECAKALIPVSNLSQKNRVGLTPFLIAASFKQEQALALMAPLSDTRARSAQGLDAIDLALTNPCDWGFFQTLCRHLSASGELPISRKGQSAQARALEFFENSVVSPSDMRAFFHALDEARQLRVSLLSAHPAEPRSIPRI